MPSPEPPPLKPAAAHDPDSTVVKRHHAGEALLLEGCELPAHWRTQPRFTVLDLGPFDPRRLWATLASLAAAPDGPVQFDYVALAHESLCDDWPVHHLRDLAPGGHPFARRLCDEWPAGAPGLHRIAFDHRDGLPAGHQARVTLAIGDPIAMLPKLRLSAEAVFIDHRTPAATLSARLAGLPRLMAPEARLGVVFDADDAQLVNAALLQRGFTVQRAGPNEANHTWAVASPNRRPPAVWPAPSRTERRCAVVVGAGLAGCASAAVLAARGWRVTVLDAAPNLDGAGGGQPRVADHPHFSADDNRLSRLSRQALSLGARWRGSRVPLGRLQLAGSEAEWAQFARWCATGTIHPSVARCIDAQEAAALAGLPLPRGGLWVPSCDAIDPRVVCRDWLRSSAHIDWRPGVRVERLRQHVDGWTLDGAAGLPVGEAPVVILANAGGALPLADMHWPRLQRTRGQSTRIQDSPWQGLRCVLGGSAYACPLGDGDILVGASTDDGQTLTPEPEADADNLMRLHAMLARDKASNRSAPPSEVGSARAQSARGASIATCDAAGVGWRFAAPDHLPLIGALPDERRISQDWAAHTRNDRLTLPTLPGLYGHFALGSRGLLWSILGAEVLASLIDGGVSPLEADLLQAIDPCRFVRQRLRRQLPI